MDYEYILTVITVTYNASKVLPITLPSVVQQTVRKKFQYILVDGASTDGTVNLIKNAAKEGLVDDWISEPDLGIYDAMNKAVSRAKGQWIIFMNAGDIFYSEKVLETCWPYLTDANKIELVYGNCVLRYPNGNEVLDSAKGIKELRHSMICSHQSLFSKKVLLEKFPFDLKYSICADYHFLLQCHKANSCFKKIDEVVAKVQLETYSWKQIKTGVFQKWSAAASVLGKVKVAPAFFVKYSTLWIKHLIKKILMFNR